MRQIGVLPDAFQAKTLADYLLTLRIETRVEQQPDGCVLWVCDEDRVAQARQEFDAFRKEPRAPRYALASQTAEAIRQKEDEVEEDYGRRQTELRELMTDPKKAQGGRPFTLALLAVSVFVSVATRFGDDPSHKVMQALFITPFRVLEDSGKSALIRWNGLDEIAAGQVWRLVTPIFIHFDVIHLLFNVLMLLQLGGAFEERRGTWRIALFIVTVAALSNVAQYYFGWVGDVSSWRKDHGPNPQFGGLSGVNYGLFGYIWMKSRYEPQLGFVVTPSLIFIMLGFFLLCLTGALGSIANVAHGVGLGVGIVVGVAPTVWRNLFGREEPSEPLI